MRKTEIDLSISVTEAKRTLLVAIDAEITDHDLEIITDIVLKKAYRTHINSVIFNFNMVTVLDSYTYQSFEKTAKVLKLMGIKVIWVGLRPAVISALMDLNSAIDVSNICTAISLEQGLAMVTG